VDSYFEANRTNELMRTLKIAFLVQHDKDHEKIYERYITSLYISNNEHFTPTGAEKSEGYYTGINSFNGSSESAMRSRMENDFVRKTAKM
jgi:hypothetical protein